ncbi:hypothetical protein ACFLUT_04330, partial [Chloroflexota bacterium]
LCTLRAHQEGLLAGTNESAMQVLDAVYRQPVLTPAVASRITGSLKAETACALVELADHGILEPHAVLSDDTYVAREVIATLEQPPAFGAGYVALF